MKNIDERIKSLEEELNALKEEKNKMVSEEYLHSVGKCFCLWSTYYKIVRVHKSNIDNELKADVIEVGFDESGKVLICEVTIPLIVLDKYQEIDEERFNNVLDRAFYAIKNQTSAFDDLKKEVEKKNVIELDEEFKTD